ncbi:hypothetical protein QUF79_14985 [Fictibacillus enclensis]|uniref:hypothetical protein n=1 Tax=Fictibacillus enclensis TaxID=1017270 RepID=UPI0025A030E5|nr:hypothetical protein [Fictibacillus enclensis]MDM5199323.1 hypothetical protein [Fictibacillus enclensis]
MVEITYQSADIARKTLEEQACNNKRALEPFCLIGLEKNEDIGRRREIGLNVTLHFTEHVACPDIPVLKAEFDVVTSKSRMEGSRLYLYLDLSDQKFMVITSESTDSYKVTIPTIFIALYNLYLYGIKCGDLDELLKLRIIISCEDIEGEIYNFNYFFQPKSYTRSSSIGKSKVQQLSLKL